MKCFFALLLPVLILISWKNEFYTRNLNQPQELDPVGTGLLFAYKMENIPLYISEESKCLLIPLKLIESKRGKKKDHTSFTPANRKFYSILTNIREAAVMKQAHL